MLLQLIVAFQLSACLFVQGQSTPARLEVAVIRPDRSAGSSIGIFPSPGRLRIQNYSLRELVEYAYQLHENQVEGGPSWVSSQKYDIEAKAEESGQVPKMGAILQALLLERFELRVHETEKLLSGYDLAVDKKGLKCTAVSPGNRTLTIREAEISAHSISMEQLADVLSGQLGQRVRDATGLRGTYDVKLSYGSTNENTEVADDAHPSIFTALKEQLGLRLESKKIPTRVLVIDSATKPLEN